MSPSVASPRSARAPTQPSTASVTTAAFAAAPSLASDWRLTRWMRSRTSLARNVRYSSRSQSPSRKMRTSAAIASDVSTWS